MTNLHDQWNHKRKWAKTASMLLKDAQDEAIKNKVDIFKEASAELKLISRTKNPKDLERLNKWTEQQRENSLNKMIQQ